MQMVESSQAVGDLQGQLVPFIEKHCIPFPKWQENDWDTKFSLHTDTVY